MERDPIAILRAAKPMTAEAPIEELLLQRILAEPRRRRRHTRRWVTVATTVAAAGLVAAFLGNGAQPPPDMRLVAAATRAAFDGTGRAEVTFATMIGRVDESSGTSNVTFEGDNIDVRTTFEGTPRGGAFVAQNKTVDGDFYLEDGPRHARYWIRDIGASEMRRSDIFNVDPRTFVEVLEPSVEFEVVATDDDGVRHLRATSVDELPRLSLGLGSVGAEDQDVTQLELWVGPDDVLQRFALTLEQTVTNEHSGARARLVRKADGTVSKEIDPAHPGKRVTETHRSSYRVRFYDLGQEITIDAPRDAVDVETKG